LSTDKTLLHIDNKIRFVLWCLFQLYRGGQFYWWRKLERTRWTPPTCSTSLTNFIT